MNSFMAAFPSANPLTKKALQQNHMDLSDRPNYFSAPRGYPSAPKRRLLVCLAPYRRIFVAFEVKVEDKRSSVERAGFWHVFEKTF